MWQLRLKACSSQRCLLVTSGCLPCCAIQGASPASTKLSLLGPTLMGGQGVGEGSLALPPCSVLVAKAQLRAAVMSPPATGFSCNGNWLFRQECSFSCFCPSRPRPGLPCRGCSPTPPPPPSQVGPWTQDRLCQHSSVLPHCLFRVQMYSRWVSQACLCVEQRSLCWIIVVRLVVTLRSDTKQSSHFAMMLMLPPSMNFFSMNFLITILVFIFSFFLNSFMEI